MLTLAALSLASVALAQKAGDLTPESHPSLDWQTCTTSGCTDVAGEVVIDANWRWFHDSAGTNCYDGNKWTSACSSNEDCAEKCFAEGADYSGTYGVTTSGNALDLRFVTEHEYGTNIGSRTYLMKDTSTYQTFDLIGNEFAFDVDLSTVECGINSALYFVPMPADGGVSSQPANTAGAEYGTGYCDAQCARDLKFLGGTSNFEGWESSDDNSGVGSQGSCCAEIDVWESNAYAFALTPHGCEAGQNEYHICEDGVGAGCGGTYSDDRYAGYCDANGCDYNPYRMGNKDFYGAGLEVDTTKPFTVVTQFTTESLTQFFVQDGARIDIPAPTWEGLPDSSQINPELCDNLFNVFEEATDRYSDIGGWSALSEGLSLPQVLVMSIWADNYANMLWLDGVWPRDGDVSQPGVERGSCPASSGVPAEVIEGNPEAHVTWSNIRFGPIGTTTEFS